MKHIFRRVSLFLAASYVFAALGFLPQARAADMSLAERSPLTGVAFDDRPMIMPEQRDFQMAMIAASSELGRSCGKMESYGWRMNAAEQARVNQIFNNAVDRLRLLGYSITPHALKSVSKDITLFSADRQDRHFVFLWSTGDTGLVLNLCETTSATATPARASSGPGAVGVFSAPMDLAPAKNAKAPPKPFKTVSTDNFSPVGTWEGYYICNGVYTGATFKIKSLRGRDFDGVFDFYPTAKNSMAPEGSYEVKGQYDRETKRMLINPGKWIKHPAGYANTVMVGGFDAEANAFSAYFEGVTGCTSFEAKREGPAVSSKALKKTAPKKAKAAKPKTAKKKKVSVEPKDAYVPTMESVPLPAADSAAKREGAKSGNAKQGSSKSAEPVIEPASSISLDGVAPPPSPMKK